MQGKYRYKNNNESYGKLTYYENGNHLIHIIGRTAVVEEGSGVAGKRETEHSDSTGQHDDGFSPGKEERH